MSRAFEKYTLIHPVVMEGFPDAHNVFLQVTNQRFCVSKHACETKDEAEWMRDQLCVALEKIVLDAGGKSVVSAVDENAEQGKSNG